MAWGKNGTNTLTGSSATIDLAALTAFKFHFYMAHTIATGGTTDGFVRLDNTTGSYANRESVNGGSDTVDTSSTLLVTIAVGRDTDDKFGISYICNISGEEALIISNIVDNGGSGAANAPARKEMVGKDAATTQFTQIDLDDSSGTGSFATGSNASILGSDLTPAAAIPFAENAQVGSRAEITDTRKMYHRDDIDWKEENGNEATNYRSDSWYEQLSGETP